ncbi:MAG: NADH-quinone oxidoreductase subunit F [Spirochaetes bacterium]|nr:MAG: NADH-quinone oxidoreductase subunit F [Spirochaetota bacterium]
MSTEKSSVLEKKDFKKILEELKLEGKKHLFPDKLKISVQSATCGKASGADEIYSTLENTLKDEDVILERVGCIGLCQQEPMVNVYVPGWKPVVYANLTPKIIEELAPQWLEGKFPEKNALGQLGSSYLDDMEGILKPVSGIKRIEDLGFFKKQLKIVLRNSGFINPLDIYEYVARGGFYSLYRVLHEYEPDQVIDDIIKSGLRGRGGGGFPTGVKWQSCRKAPGFPKYVICNADEGDPGAYMDRATLEGDPFGVLEGMVIGAYAIGSNQGYIYVRAEYPLAVQTLHKAIKIAGEFGFLGKNIMGKDFSFDIKINRGGGAFVCGESTALMASIEGKVGEPRVKHIHTVVSGLREKPTVLNNVETWANVPRIIEMGVENYNKIGTKGSKGTKVFSLVGNVNNNGLVEVPMGITLREMIFNIGGGIPENKKFKAVQTGGPSGGCIPESLLDMPVDFDELIKVGSMMGSGGMIVMDEDTCMVDVARYFLSFLVEESCGKCTPCREGTYQLYKIVDRITRGEGREDDIELMEELAETIKDASLCALGKTAPNPVLTTLRYFKDEYIAHIKEKKCPAGVCKELITYFIIEDKCTACGMCKKNCPVGAIEGEKKVPHKIIQEKCTKCGICLSVCKFDAVVKK